MTGQKVNWNRQIITVVNPALKRFEHWLNEHGDQEAFDALEKKSGPKSEAMIAIKTLGRSSWIS